MGLTREVSGKTPHETFYRSMFALVLETLRSKKMSWGGAQGRENFPAIDNLESELSKKGFGAAD